MTYTFKDILADFREVREAQYRDDIERDKAVAEAMADLFDETLVILGQKQFICQSSKDLNDILLDFTNYMQNERVRAYNEGVDTERERCAKIAEAYKADEPETVRNINYRNGIAAMIRELK